MGRKPKVGPFSCKQRKQRGTKRRDLTKDRRRKTRGENKEVEMARRNLGFYTWRPLIQSRSLPKIPSHESAPSLASGYNKALKDEGFRSVPSDLPYIARHCQKSQSLHSLHHPLSMLPAPTGYNWALKGHCRKSESLRCITTNCLIEFSCDSPIRTTPSHTVYNGKFNGRDVCFFLPTRMDDSDAWIKDSQSFLSDNFLRVYCDFAGPNGRLLCTERVVCSLSDYFVGKALHELKNKHAIHSSIIPIVRDLFRIVSDFKSNGKHSNLSVDCLYWTGTRVVVAFRRFVGDRVLEDDYHGLEETLTSLFGGSLPLCLRDFFRCLRGKIALDYLLENHYALMSSEVRLCWRSYVVRHLLEGSIRSSNMEDLRRRWRLRGKKTHNRKVVVPQWQAALQSYAGATTDEQARWRSQRPDCPVQYFIMARNIGTHRTHDCGASVVDHDLLTTFPEQENLMLMSLHDIIGPAFLFVRV